MKKKLYIIVLLLAFVLIITACAPSPNESEVITEYFEGGDAWIRTSIEELSAFATEVIKAEVLDSRVERINTLLSDFDFDDEIAEQFIMLHTVHRLRVLEVFDGGLEVGDIVEVMQKGGRLGNHELIYNRQLPLESGDSLIFFLRSFEAQGFGHLPMALEAGSQAVYRIAPQNETNELEESIEDAFRANPSVSEIVLLSLDLSNNLTLTVGDLMQIANIADSDIN
jgi:hypothetical protein